MGIVINKSKESHSLVKKIAKMLGYMSEYLLPVSKLKECACKKLFFAQVCLMLFFINTVEIVIELVALYFMSCIWLATVVFFLHSMCQIKHNIHCTADQLFMSKHGK